MTDLGPEGDMYIEFMKRTRFLLFRRKLAFKWSRITRQKHVYGFRGFVFDALFLGIRPAIKQQKMAHIIAKAYKKK